MLQTRSSGEPRESATLVLGIGNSILTDEGVGVHTISHLRESSAAWPEVVFLDGGTLGMSLVGRVAEADQLIVIDSAQLHAEPGTVRLFVGDEFDAALHKRKSSAHEVDLVDLMQAALLMGGLPQNRALVAVQPAELGWGDEPSPAVALAIPEASRVVLELLGRWSSETKRVSTREGSVR